jgi:hypothetical protein
MGGRPFREAELRSYIIREHRRGRPLGQILDDPYVTRYGDLCWRVLTRPDTIAALEADVCDSIRACVPDSPATGAATRSG